MHFLQKGENRILVIPDYIIIIIIIIININIMITIIIIIIIIITSSSSNSSSSIIISKTNIINTMTRASMSRPASEEPRKTAAPIAEENLH